MRKYGRSIEIETTVTVDMDEFETEDLIEELERRGKYDVKETLLEFKTSEDLIKYIKNLVGLKSYHSKERMIQEINEL